ncbi:hypothetical protein QCA50_010110 [Cerrena zonata]|uniref:SWIM-type domain-containing protein n=1 Tax=Cerrena zonata TaxID=2478898 RepID=A0AAW0G299_9APHY
MRKTRSRPSLTQCHSPPISPPPPPLYHSLPRLHSAIISMSKSFHLAEDGLPAGVVDPLSWDNRRLDVTINLNHLYCSEEQRQAILQLPTSERWTQHCFSLTAEQQARANTMLRQHQLDAESLEMLESRWSVAWSNSWMRKGSNERVHRTLYQCVCGYDTNSRKKGKKKQERCDSEVKSKPSSASQCERRAPYDFTGCLVHADITHIGSHPPTILRIIGYFSHNNACVTSKLKRFPSIPLHPHVWEVALRQIRKGAGINAIQSENISLFESSAYKDQTAHTNNPLSANYRFLIRSGDFSRLYRRHNLETYGIDVSVRAEHNVDNWLNPNNKHFRKSIFDSVFHYAARTCEEDRFKVCIASSEMREAAWKYCHNKQLLLDGTFGLCTSRLLLWIAMGIDESGSGIPVALFLFSAPTGNRATHAGYNTSILAELLGTWHNWLGSCYDEPFKPYVAMTDTDLKERGALVLIWKDIILLLCKFHVRQCWTNKRKALRISAGGSHWKAMVRSRFLSLEEALLETTNHSNARDLITNERKECEKLQRMQDPEANTTGEAGICFLEYLMFQWMPIEIWCSWSRFGRENAATRLGIPTAKVLTTTNNLEALNGSLKRKYLDEWKRAGHRLRFDVLIYHLAKHILPHIYARRRTDLHYVQWRAQRFLFASGGDVIATQHGRGHPTKLRTWFTPDENRDLAAQRLFAGGNIKPIPSGRQYELWARCTSESHSDVSYWLTVHPTGSATCTCLDWMHRGGACKHLRAFRKVIEQWSRNGILEHPFLFASSQIEAEEVDVRNECWYASKYLLAITHSPSASNISSGLILDANRIRLDGDHTTRPPHMSVTAETHFLLPPTIPESEMPSLAQEAMLHSDCIRDEDIVSSHHELDPHSNNENLSPEAHASRLLPGSDNSRKRTFASQVSCNAAALSTQLQQQLHHDINTALPILHGILSNLDHPGDSIQLENSDSISEFRELLELLENSLASKLCLTPMGSSEETVLDLAIPSITPDSSRIVLPPSPEPRQKRKKSHKTM